MPGKIWIALGAACGALAVACGAFGAHSLAETLKETGRADVFETAARYHMYHALALVLVGILSLEHSSLGTNIAGVCFAGGILIFSGLLYAYALGGPKILGAFVPIGGTAFIVGWVALAICALVKRSPPG